MKKIILETDMGADSDDAVALNLLIALCRKGECALEAVVASSTRSYATGAINAILNYFGFKTAVGRCYEPVLECDSLDYYAKRLTTDSGARIEDNDAVSVARKTLAMSQEKITYVSVGPLGNLARLFKSGADEYSKNDGVGLFKEKVDTLFVMGSSFDNNKNVNECGGEWNIIQDIPGAAYVVANCPVPIIFVPYGLGKHTFTGAVLKDIPNHPVYTSILCHSEGYYILNERGRESWDPVTCLCAVRGYEQWYDASPFGDARVSEDGSMSFKESKTGKHRYLFAREDLKIPGLIIDGLLMEASLKNT